MAKKLIRRFLPEPGSIRRHKHLRIFGEALHDPNLWHLNRKSVPVAFAIGLFMAFVPMPFQMIPAAALAIAFRANIIISVVLVWISNPITIPPIFFFCYKVGTWIIGRKLNQVSFDLSWEWMRTELMTIWQPLLLGCFVVSTISAVIGYYGMQWFWRLHVVSEWEKRKNLRAKRKQAETNK
ncbi:MAG: DUF2062 domain-containing protein [Gammaproteobacteria bacterium]|nr:DUF2062 domain-containing protein [Gammaproteobacteria bacterium]